MTPLEIALAYVARNWNPVPVAFRDKKPIAGEGWQSIRIDAANARRFFDGGPQNIGVQLGPTSSGLTDVDLDCREALIVAPYLLPQTDAIFGRSSKRCSHCLYVTNLAETTDRAVLKFADPNDGEVLVELRIGGHEHAAQTVFPGSVHVSGEPTAWEKGGDGEPAEVDGLQLEYRVRLVAVAALFARAWPGVGGRHDAALVVGGFLARAGVSGVDCALMIEAISRAAGDPEWRDRLRAVKDAQRHQVTTGRAYGLPKLAEVLGEKTAVKAAEWLGYSEQAAEGETEPQGSARARKNNHSWDEPDFSLLDERRGILPQLELPDVLRESRRWVATASHAAGVSDAHVFVPLLGIASALIGAARRVRASTSWSVPLTCWTSIVGYSGSGKTPGIDATKRTLNLIEGNRKNLIEEMQRAHNTKVELARAKREAWREQVAEAVRSGREPPVQPEGSQDPGKFVPPRLYVSDGTIERLAVLLQARPAGLLVLVDELAGIFSNMARYNRGQDSEFWLTAWNGDAYLVERMNRPSVYVEHLLIGLTGGIQPDKAARVFADADDGMYARFLFSWPEEPKWRPLSNDVQEVDGVLYITLERLIKLSGDNPENIQIGYLRLSEEALGIFERLRRHVHEERAALDGKERDWLCKIPAHALRLSGTLTLLEWALAAGDRAEPTEINGDLMQGVCDLLLNYFWPHARATMRLIGLSDYHANARRVLKWFRAKGVDEVSREDIRRDALSQRLDADDTQALIDRLVTAGWLRELPTNGGAAHRPKRRWEVNARLFVGGA